MKALRAFLRSLFGRLALSYLVVAGLGIAAAAPLAWLAVERLYVATQRDNLLAQAKLVAAALGSQPVEMGAAHPNAMPYLQSSNAMPGIHTRVIDPQGGALIDLSGGIPGQSENLALPELAQGGSGGVSAAELLGRPEIAQAQSGQAASAVRSLPGAGGRQVLYAAAPVLDAAGLVTQIVYLATPLPEPQALQVGLLAQAAWAMLVAALLAGAAGLLLARRFARPLARLALAAQAVADGDLSQSVPVDRSVGELETLGGAFNQMTASLRQADQAKTAFISDVSHELRTPLTVIKGTIETLQDGALDDLEARGPFLESMNRETERLIRLVNDLLVLTRADANALNLRLQPVRLAEFARVRAAQLARLAGARQVRITVSGENGCFASADPDRLAQVLDNLLDNAIRYAPPESEIRVTVSQADGRATCEVADGGPGIAAPHLPLVFERFYRADPGRGRGQGGSGLGLAIVRSLVRAHGGEVVASSPPGQGAVFTFWLPAA